MSVGLASAKLHPYCHGILVSSESDCAHWQYCCWCLPAGYTPLPWLIFFRVCWSVGLSFRYVYFFLSSFLLPNSDFLPTMSRYSVRANRKLEEIVVWCGTVEKHQAESEPEFESASIFCSLTSQFTSSPMYFCKIRGFRTGFLCVPSYFFKLLPSFTCYSILTGLKIDSFLGEAFISSLPGISLAFQMGMCFFSLTLIRS